MAALQTPTWELLALRERQRTAYSSVTRPTTPTELFYDVTDSRKNKLENRYTNILAYDRTAVTVEGDYLNANVIKDGFGRWWVASQAPLPSTIQAFFGAISTKSASKHPLIKAETSGAIIIQLTGEKENGARKADPYINTYQIERRERRDDLASIVSDFQVESVTVKHYLFNGWPDFGVPSGPAVNALVRLIREIREVGQNQEIWVHCSAGVGRSGTFIALASLIDRGVATEAHESGLDPLPTQIQADAVAVTVDSIREWRGALIQTPEQFELVYKLGNHQK